VSGPSERYDLVVVTPVLNDWPSLQKLIGHLAEQDVFSGKRLAVVAVDDGSSIYDPPQERLLTGPIEAIEVVRLRANQGHQRAIALGLAHVAENYAAEAVMVMDSDGEDRPEEAARLWRTYEGAPGNIIVARRRKRSEGFAFRLFYRLYKFAFRRLTGKEISFGNFSLVPADKLQNVLFNDTIWNSYAATLLRSRVPLTFVETDRGTRYFGSSSMNFTSLLLHGLSGVAAFGDVVIGRIVIALIAITLLFGLAVAAIVALKFGAGFFIPGYATTVVLFLTNMLLNAILLGFLVIMTLLATRNQRAALPAAAIEALIGARERVERRKEAAVS
jgi:glycosyltransferase involved in cell wall biosynthesis